MINDILDSFLNLILNDTDFEMKYFCLNILSNNKTIL